MRSISISTGLQLWEVKTLPPLLPNAEKIVPSPASMSLDMKRCEYLYHLIYYSLVESIHASGIWVGNWMNVAEKFLTLASATFLLFSFLLFTSYLEQ